ncbi:MAG TPA: hypothetical protein VGM37_11580 [Armatimonadota bacterium]|jgi:hypothetical protein
MRTFALALALVCLPAAAQNKAPKQAKPAPPPPAPLREWTNAGDAALEVSMDGPKDAVLVELGRQRRPYRILPSGVQSGQLRFTVPPGATAQAWSREALAAQKTGAFSTAARMGAFPEIIVGTVVVTPGKGLTATDHTPAWQSSPGRYRAYPGGGLPVAVTVRNEGKFMWKRPRVRLFAPDNWTVSPATADISSPLIKAPKPGAKNASVTGLAPGMEGVAIFTVTLPKGATMGSTSPLAAFLRFEAVGQTVTVQNNVDVTAQEPIERRYAMTEDGGKFIVRLINRFAPTPLGAPKVEVRQPAGTTWNVTSPKPEQVQDDADAIAEVKTPPPGDDQIGVPVVVTLNDYRMGYTPVVYATARYGSSVEANSREKGLRWLKAAGTPFAPFAEGMCAHLSSSTQNTLAFEVAEKFAVSDPAIFVSPTWVTVTLIAGNATRARLEYDAFGSPEPTVAGDIPVENQAGEQTLTFLLPDARFQGGLPGKADFRLIFSGDPCVTRVTVSKWNPTKAAG